MERTGNAIKEFILGTVNDYIKEYATDDCPMNELTDKTVVFGAVDPSRYESKVLCAIVPDEQEDEEEEIGAYRITSGFTVSFLCRGYEQETLVRQMCRYGAAFRRAVLDDVSLGHTVERSEVGRRQFYTDAGTVKEQATAVDIGLTVVTTDEIDIDDF